MICCSRPLPTSLTPCTGHERDRLGARRCRQASGIDSLTSCAASARKSAAPLMTTLGGAAVAARGDRRPCSRVLRQSPESCAALA